jgi:50S ribosomal subunit-associated GTPase HflX
VERMDELATEGSVALTLRIPQSEGSLLARIHRHGRVLQTSYEGDAVRLVAVLPPRLAETCAEFILDDTQIKLAPPAYSLQTR